MFLRDLPLYLILKTFTNYKYLLYIFGSTTKQIAEDTYLEIFPITIWIDHKRSHATKPFTMVNKGECLMCCVSVLVSQYCITFRTFFAVCNTGLFSSPKALGDYLDGFCNYDFITCEGNYKQLYGEGNVVFFPRKSRRTSNKKYMIRITRAVDALGEAVSRILAFASYLMGLPYKGIARNYG